MKYIAQRLSLCTLLLLIFMLSGCSGIKLTMSEQATIQEVLDTMTLLEDYRDALLLLDAEDTHADELKAVTEDIQRVNALIPSQLRAYPEGLPGRVNIEEEQKVEILTTAYPLSQQTVKQVSALFNALAVPKLEQVASNLAIIWSVESVGIEAYRRSQTYVEAHNAFLAVRRQFPQLTLEPSVQFADQFVEFDSQDNQLIAKAEELPIPGVLTTAEYIQRSNKICEKILFHYLTKRGDILIATGKDVALSEGETSAQQKNTSTGRRILTALNETFGPIDVMPAILDRHFSVSFRRGGYTLSHLSREDRSALQANLDQITAELQTYDTTSPLVITITTVGYTDETPLRENNRFVQNFISSLRDAGERLPQGQPARKLVLNKHFSRLRALIINEHIQQHLQQVFEAHTHLNIVSEIIGKGEELPEGVTESASAEERRLCEVTVVVQSEGGY